MVDIDLLNDQAVYRRTMRGQQELLSACRVLTRTERRLLAVVTGLTPVRILLDMGFDATDARVGFATLIEMGLVESVSEHEN